MQQVYNGCKLYIKTLPVLCSTRVPVMSDMLEFLIIIDSQ